MADIPDIWKDENVKAALREGRPAHDIQTLECPDCQERSYWNEGSHFTCRLCDRSFYVATQDELESLDARTAYVMAEECVQLADLCGEPEPGP